MRAEEIKFRASSMENLMTNDRSGKGLGATCKKEILKAYAREVHGRYEEISNKYLEKGNAREADAITLLSRVKKIFFKKNTVRLYNDFITGEPDLFLGESIEKADEIFDTKCSYSAKTFLEAKYANTESYFYQMQCYMALTGAKKATVSYCLVNATADAINDEKRKLQWKLGIIDPSNPTPLYLEKAQQLEINMIYDLGEFIKEFPHFNLDVNVAEWHYDIPMQERIHSIVFERDELEIQKIYDRVALCREWMQQNLFINQPQAA